ncbi:hypothetical protein IWQ56_001413 [Coemansia nantahalensis]|nr:hypothetical protein IWQ56_001413 [Coemansia nantahalensis]
MPGADVDVRLACVRCWATLVYALGEEIGSHIDIIARVVALVADDARADVRAVVARVLASLFNKFALAESSVAQFVIPRMVIGTTTLAASDGKSLSDTHGPFSSESSYGADHTVVLCKYVTGLGASSPTVPVVADTAVKFIHRYLLAERRAAEDCGPSADPQDPQRRHRSFAGLCKALAAAIAALAATQQRQLTTAITRVFVSTLAPPGARDLALDSGYVCGYDRSPHALLYVALVDGLGDGLRLARLDAPELLLGKECDPAGAAADPARAALLPPDRAFAPTCLGALACRHALWMGLQARALASCGPEDRRDVVVEAAARLVRELLPGEPELRAGREGTADDALAAVAMGSLLDIEGLPHAVQSALAQMFDRATAAMRASPPSPHTPLVLSAALFSGTGPGAPDLLKARERAVSCLGAAAADSGGFWQGVFHLLADRVLDDPRPLGACEPRLVAALCSGCEPKAHGSQDAAYCLGLATVAFGLAFGAPAADAGEAIRELARAVRRELDGAATGSPQQLLSRVLLPLVRDAAERVVSSHAGEDVDAARRSMAAFVASAVRGSAADPESESAREVVAAAERLLRARSVRRAAEDVAAAEPSLPLPLECAQPAVAPDTPAGETPADPRGIRKHKQSPVSSDQDDDSGDDDDGRAAAAELAQTPQRRRRKKRAKRRAPVSRASSPSGPEDAAPDRLLEAVDHLEAALQAAAPCSVRRLLAVQARISDVQQRLCEAMRQGLEPARDG